MTSNPNFKCVVADCPTNSARPEERDKTFYFPRNDARRIRWMHLVGRCDLVNKPYAGLKGQYGSGVCARHFQQHHFATPENLSLNRNAEPNPVGGSEVEHRPAAAPSPVPCVPVSSALPVSVWTPSQEPPSASTRATSPLLPVTPKRQRTSSSEHVHLRDLGVTRTAHLSPRKKFIYAKLQQVERTVKVLKGRRVFPKTHNPLDSASHLQDLPKTLKLFFFSQLRNYQKSKKARRYTFQDKSMFLSIFKHSPKCYRYLQKLLSLPSSRTLRKVSSNFNLRPGINERMFRYLRVVSESMNELDRYCVHMFDEMEIMKNLRLVAGNGTCRIEGFVNLGTDSGQHIADHALVFMIRGIRRRWKQPVAYYFTRNCANRWVLKSLICEMIRAIHTLTKFKVVASVSDAGSWNVAAVRLLTSESGRDPKDFIFNVDSNKIFHLFDAPHLIKCMRNNFINRNILFGVEKVAKWEDIKACYFQDGALPTAKVSKLTRKHVEPTHREKMRVKLAVQVFSHTTVASLELLSHHKVINGLHTAESVGFMNDLFDSMNSEFKSTTPSRSRVTSVSPHLDFWLSAKITLDRLIFFNEHGNKVVTPGSVRLFIYTLRNVQSLWQLLSGNGFKYLVTKCLNQDPVENFFSVVRGLCGCNTRPTSSQFASAYKTCVLNNTVKSCSGSNCEDDGERFLLSYDILCSMMEPGIPSPNVSHGTSIPSTSTSHEPDILPTTAHEPFNAAVDMAKRLCNLAGSYIAGYLIKKLLHHKCQSCTHFLLSDTCTDIHDVIRLKEYSKDVHRLIYPSEPFVQAVNEAKDKIFRQIPLLIHLPDFFNRLIHTTYSIPSNFCPEHGVKFQAQTVHLLCLVMVHHFIKIVNLKIHNKDSRPNEIIDTFLRSAL